MPNKIRCVYAGWLKFTGIVAQLALCGTLVVLMRGKAQEAASDVDSGTSQNGHVCFLAISDTWMAACTFAEVLAYSGLLLSFSTATLQAYVNIASNRLDQQLPDPGPGTKKSLGWACWTQQLLLVVSLLWWLTGGTLLQVHLTQADAAGVPQPAVRAAVSACCWLSVVLLVGLLALELLLRPGPPSSTGTPMFCSFLPTASVPVLAAAPAAPSAAAVAVAAQQQQQQTPLGRSPPLSALLPALVVGQPQAGPPQHQQQHQLLSPSQVIGIPVLQAGQPPTRTMPQLPPAPPATTPAAAALAVLPAAAGHNISPAQLQMSLLASGVLQASPAVRQHHVSTWAAASTRTATSQGTGARSSRSRSATTGDVVMRVAVVHAGAGRSRSHSHQQMPSLQGVQPFGQRDRGQQHQAVQQNRVVQHQAPNALGGRLGGA